MAPMQSMRLDNRQTGRPDIVQLFENARWKENHSSENSEPGNAFPAAMRAPVVRVTHRSDDDRRATWLEEEWVRAVDANCESRLDFGSEILWISNVFCR